jgi:hypothetical protein
MRLAEYHAALGVFLAEAQSGKTDQIEMTIKQRVGESEDDDQSADGDDHARDSGSDQ